MDDADRDRDSRAAAEVFADSAIANAPDAPGRAAIQAGPARAHAALAVAAATMHAADPED